MESEDKPNRYLIESQKGEKFYRSVLDRMHEAVFILNKNFLIIDANDAASRTTGLGRKELIGKHCYQVSHGHNRPCREVGEPCVLPEVFDTGMPATVLHKHTRVDGSVCWVDVLYSPFKGPDGRVLYVIEAMRDVTELLSAHERLKSALKGIIQSISALVEIRDPYTAGHSQRVVQLADAVAKEMGLSEEQIEGIRVAGIIHDIGKITVPAEILSKPGRLSEIEFSIIKTHPQAGYAVIKGLEFPWPVAQTVLQHHEKLDGSGYPTGLSGDKILLEARILAVADVVESISSHRPYRPALGIDKALEEISKNKGILLYDARVVDACVRLFKEKGFKFE
ncbi:MAG TPA: HD domain-containing phosphohydrolase [Candidatus Avalokitesvara rifleensis]|uniref:HD domain-containing phosphohydrolase n=1 Tax=Candidatus Avalokitesvara rifleensis TaxID=3367620 RepID=UPI00271409D0|nr:HD domain-containing protein [Candidatus Brocadiales bacterium]